jgi:hypothetical protein
MGSAPSKLETRTEVLKALTSRSRLVSFLEKTGVEIRVEQVPDSLELQLPSLFGVNEVAWRYLNCKAARNLPTANVRLTITQKMWALGSKERVATFAFVFARTDVPNEFDGWQVSEFIRCPTRR